MGALHLLVYAAAGGGIAYFLFDAFDKSSGFTRLEPVQQHIYFHSENAFYYSYFHHVVRANSTRDAIMSLVADSRTEFPDVINALERFNVYQEAILGFVYRFGGARLGSPMQFYLGSIFALQARWRSPLAWSRLGGSQTCGRRRGSPRPHLHQD